MVYAFTFLFLYALGIWTLAGAPVGVSMKRALQTFLCHLLMLGLLWAPLIYSILKWREIGAAL